MQDESQRVRAECSARTCRKLGSQDIGLTVSSRQPHRQAHQPISKAKSGARVSTLHQPSKGIASFSREPGPVVVKQTRRGMSIPGEVFEVSFRCCLSAALQLA